jgi:hypothetical protein
MLKQGLIYEIVCNETNERYIGSTFEPTVARRIAYHRRQHTHICSSKQIIDRNNYIYGLLETVNVNSRDELRMKEREWFDKLECINIRKPFRREDEKQDYKKEYYNSHQEYYKTKRKEYNESHQEERRLRDIANAEELRIKRKEYNERRKLQKIKQN